MANANGNFHHDDYGTGAFNFVARKTINPHWSFQTGFGFSSVGFNFTITQDYSLLNPDGQYTGNSIECNTVVLPATIVYNTNLTCRNWRWFIGGGLSFISHSNEKDDDVEMDVMDNSSIANLTQSYDFNGGFTLNGHLIGGIEKVFRNQSILSFGLIGSLGTSTVGTTSVSYTLDGTDYNHSFTNRGNYFGCYINYYFRPLGSKKAK